MARLADTSSDADERFPITGGTALVVESEVLGKPQSYGLFVTARDGWTIAVVRWNRHTASTCDELATAVSLLDGSVTGRAPVSEKRTEVRRAYSVRDQVYLNPSDRLRVEAPEGSTVVAGADALRRGGAAVAIVSAGLEVQVTSARPSNATVVGEVASRPKFCTSTAISRVTPATAARSPLMWSATCSAARSSAKEWLRPSRRLWMRIQRST